MTTGCGMTEFLMLAPKCVMVRKLIKNSYLYSIPDCA